MAIFLRIDDFPGTKPEEFWKHNLDNFKVFDALLEKHQIDYTVGVIPKYTTQKEIDWLAQNPRATVALHGIEHDERFPNEFHKGETKEQITRSIRSAVEPLKICNGNGIVDTYIPPHNVIDFRTACALRDCGFKKLLCGPGTDDSELRYIVDNAILDVYYSRHPKFYGRSDEMMDRDMAVEAIELQHRLGTDRDCYVTLHWTWEWNIGLQSLDLLMSKIGYVFRGDM